MADTSSEASQKLCNPLQVNCCEPQRHGFFSFYFFMTKTKHLKPQLLEEPLVLACLVSLLKLDLGLSSGLAFKGRISEDILIDNSFVQGDVHRVPCGHQRILAIRKDSHLAPSWPTVLLIYCVGVFLVGLVWFFGDIVSLCCTGWSAVAQSQLSVNSASWVSEDSPAQPPEKLGLRACTTTPG
ncbi:hypothetical protein AAY473_025860 [Plecturocebus cupreus]